MLNSAPKISKLHSPCLTCQHRRSMNRCGRLGVIHPTYDLRERLLPCWRERKRWTALDRLRSWLGFPPDRCGPEGRYYWSQA